MGTVKMGAASADPVGLTASAQLALTGARGRFKARTMRFQAKLRARTTALALSLTVAQRAAITRAFALCDRLGFLPRLSSARVFVRRGAKRGAFH
jgi:hypothetical protein